MTLIASIVTLVSIVTRRRFHSNVSPFPWLQLGAAYAQMQALEEEINRKEAEIRNERLKRKQVSYHGYYQLSPW